MAADSDSDMVDQFEFELDQQIENEEDREKLFWENVQRVDPAYNLKIMTGLLMGWFKRHPDLTPRDLELELRSRRLHTGLIVQKLEHPHITVGSRQISVIRTQLLSTTPDELSRIPAEEKCTCNYMLISCRPRRDVIVETLEHNASMEENLERLKTAGIMMQESSHSLDVGGAKEECKEGDDDEDGEGDEAEVAGEPGSGEATAAPADDNGVEDSAPTSVGGHIETISSPEHRLMRGLHEGTVRIKVKQISLRDCFQSTCEQNPDISPQVIGFTKEGQRVLGLVRNGRLICPVGVIPSGGVEVKYLKLG